MIFTCLDLELNKENGICTDIIQIGAVVGNSSSGVILARFREYVKIDKPLSPFIVGLTGIEESDLKQKGISLLEAYEKLKNLHVRLKSHKMLLQWGGGDEYTLRKQLLAKGMDKSEWVFGHTTMNVKNVAQSFKLANNKSMQGGLKNSCNHFGLSFTGRPHDALDDAENTFKLFHKLLWRML